MNRDTALEREKGGFFPPPPPKDIDIVLTDSQLIRKLDEHMASPVRAMHCPTKKDYSHVGTLPPVGLRYRPARLILIFGFNGSH